MVEFNNELRSKVELALHRASIYILTKYMLDSTLQDKINVFEGSKEEETLKKDFTAELFTFLDKEGLDSKLLDLIKQSITYLFDLNKIGVQAILSVTKHESNYLNSTLNSNYDDLLRKTGLWNTISIDDKNYLDAFVCNLKLRYEEPNKFSDYINKWDNLLKVLNGIANESKQFGAPATYDKLNNLIKFDTLIENFK